MTRQVNRIIDAIAFLSYYCSPASSQGVRQAAGMKEEGGEARLEYAKTKNTPAPLYVDSIAKEREKKLLFSTTFLLLSQYYWRCFSSQLCLDSAEGAHVLMVSGSWAQKNLLPSLPIIFFVGSGRVSLLRRHNSHGGHALSSKRFLWRFWSHGFGAAALIGHDDDGKEAAAAANSLIIE